MRAGTGEQHAGFTSPADDGEQDGHEERPSLPSADDERVKPNRLLQLSVPSAKMTAFSSICRSTAWASSVSFWSTN